MAIIKRPKLSERIKAAIARLFPRTLQEEVEGGAAPSQFLDPAPYRAMRRQSARAVLWTGGTCLLLLVPYSHPFVPPWVGFVASAAIAPLAIYGLIQNQNIRAANLFFERQRAINIDARDAAMLKALQIQENKIVALPDPAVMPDDPRAYELTKAIFCLGYQIRWESKQVGPAFERHKIVPAEGVKIEGLLKLGQNLQVYLATDTPPLIGARKGHIAIDLPLSKSERKLLLLSSYVYADERALTEPVRIAIGVNLEGRLIEAELSDPNTCHFLVGGTTGSGKSEFLRSLILSLLARYSPRQLRMVIVDPKRVTFPELEKMPWLLAPIAKEGDAAIEVMTQLFEEMESRYRLFEQVGVSSLQAFNQQSSEQLPVMVCVFDEYADFMAEKPIKDALELSIKRLGAKARAAGIHLIVATQRPEAKVVTPLIRSNLPGRVALRVATPADSEIILGLPGDRANNLSGKGDLLLLRGSDLERLQAPLSDAGFIEEIVGRYPSVEFAKETSNTPKDSPQEIQQKLKELSMAHGWIKARFASQNLRCLDGFSADEVRAIFRQMASTGCGQIRGVDSRLEWCLEPKNGENTLLSTNG